MAAPDPRPRIHLGDAFAGKGILLLGGTGFLGKVVVGMLLEHFPDIRRLYLMVRARDLKRSRIRFREMVEESAAWEPLRRRLGERRWEFLGERVEVVGGDITEDDFGYPESEAARIAGDIDLVLNCSGRVEFNPPLENSMATNVRGTRNVIAFARRMERPALVHISTCFVAGNRSGEIYEDEPLIGYFPRRDREDQEFRVDREIEDCERLAARVRDESDDKSRADEFSEAARRRFMEEGRNPDDARALRLAIAAERRNWVRRRLRDLGIEKAQGWGWPNIYTYTKSLGDQLVAEADDLVRAIVRPSVVESALSFPQTGWNEGFTTSAPLVRMALKGQNLFPVKDGVVLDIVPVDFVASATLAVAAETMVREPHLVYQVASGDRNPCEASRLVDLTGIYKRRHFQQKTGGLKLWNEILGRMEATRVDSERFEKQTLKWMRRSARELHHVLDRASGEPLGPLVPAVEHLRRRVRSFDDFVGLGERHYRTFRPFIAGERFIFRSDNTRDLFTRLDGNDGRLYFSPEELDWYDYWLHVHLPGLEKWVFPTLEREERRRRPRRVYQYKSLVELFESCTRNHAGRVAMRITRDGREERYTYQDVRECVLRAAAFLRAAGFGPGDHIALLGANAPEWGMAYFAIVRIGAVAIPLDRDTRPAEIRRLLDAGHAAALLVDDALHERHGPLGDADSGPSFRDIPFAELFAVGDEAEEARAIEALPPPPTATTLASILFTSGTTGSPKGVMLTHRNFASLVAKLLTLYDIGPKDGALSVLPLHHSFEFTTGFLLPLSRGAQITYLHELSGETITRELGKGQTTCIVGVPALWEMFRKNLLKRFGDRSSRAEDLFVALVDAAWLLREDTGVNLGPALFLPIHAALGGRIRYLISGASALSETDWKFFRGLGFHLAQGYGLTEAAPVLTVTPPTGRVPLGSAGRSLPGIEVRIADPDASGVGEVIARGPNVMRGYYGNEEATREVLRDGWLYTGDLGRLDEDGHLFLSGRRKDVIVNRGGRNIYPDELEDLYAEAEQIREMTVVAFPDGAAETPAVVVVAKDDGTESRDRIRAHFRTVAARLALHKRIGIVEFHDGPLPRTATRKVKRREVVRWLVRQRRAAAAAEAGQAEAHDRLFELVASVCERPVGELRAGSRFAELGFDSLMYNDLVASVGSEFGVVVSPEELSRMETLEELSLAVGSARPRRKATRRPSSRADAADGEEIEIPPALRKAGRAGLTQAQRWFYHQVLEPTFTGRAYIPSHTHYLVVANHASHLDMGLVKMALGDQGSNLVVLAAADYFFDNKLKRTFFHNFTSLAPMERRGSLKQSLEMAAGFVSQGHSVLIFPEGTRSRSGEIAPFRRGFAHLAFRCGVGVLPMHLDTWKAFPPGAVGLRSRRVAARIGPFLSHEFLLGFDTGSGRRARDQAVADVVQAMVERLGRNEPIRLEELAERFRPPAREAAARSAGPRSGARRQPGERRSTVAG